MKTKKLTLIELLISMAIFTLMVALLIKAFQVSTDTASRLEKQSQAYDYGRLAMNLITDDLNKHIASESKTFKYNSTSGEYDEFNKSLYFFAESDTQNGAIVFFTQSPEADEFNINYVKAVEYRITTIGNSTGLFRREKNYVPENRSGVDNLFTSLFNNNIHHFETLTSTTDESLVISNDNLVSFSIEVKGTDLNNNKVNFSNTGKQTLKEVEQIRFAIELKDQNASGDSTNRHFTRTVFLKR